MTLSLCSVRSHSVFLFRPLKLLPRSKIHNLTFEIWALVSMFNCSHACGTCPPLNNSMYVYKIQFFCKFNWCHWISNPAIYQVMNGSINHNRFDVILFLKSWATNIAHIFKQFNIPGFKTKTFTSTKERHRSCFHVRKFKQNVCCGSQ